MCRSVTVRIMIPRVFYQACGGRAAGRLKPRSTSQFRIRPPARGVSRARTHRHGLPLKPGPKVLQNRFCTAL